MTQDRDDAIDEGTGAEIEDGERDPAREEGSDTDEECLIVEVRVPVDAFPFGEALSRLDTRVEFEQIVPATENQLPYLWVGEEDGADFEAAVSADPTVERFRHITELNGDSGLYELEWTDSETTLLSGSTAATGRSSS